MHSQNHSTAVLSIQDTLQGALGPPSGRRGLKQPLSLLYF